MTPLGSHELSRLRRSAEELFARAEGARDQVDLEGAARLFGRAAGTWRSTGDALEAADAYLELGAVLVRQGRGRILPELAERLLGLLKIDPLPEGALLRLRVFAVLMAKGATEREAVLGLVRERRLARFRTGQVHVQEQPAGEGIGSRQGDVVS